MTRSEPDTSAIARHLERFTVPGDDKFNRGMRAGLAAAADAVEELATDPEFMRVARGVPLRLVLERVSAALAKAKVPQ